MRSVFSEFKNLWPESSRPALQPLLEKIRFYYYPEEAPLLKNENYASSVIVIVKAGDMKDIVKLALLGFDHIVQYIRPDFSEELLASALMVSRPEAFKSNPIPFFFTGFANTANKKQPDVNLVKRFTRSTEKSALLGDLSAFFKKTPQMQALTDVAVQLADEMITNAFYNAPVDFRGEHLNRNFPRTKKIELPEAKAVTFFACYSDYRITVGCQDQFGSLKRPVFITHLEAALGQDQAKPRPPQSAGAGLGLRYMIENSAGFYIYCEGGKKSLVACSLVLQGLKANVGPQKHIHISIEDN